MKIKRTAACFAAFVMLLTAAVGFSSCDNDDTAASSAEASTQSVQPEVSSEAPESAGESSAAEESIPEEESQVESSEFIIAENGSMLAAIAVGASATGKELAAAKDLREYIKKLTGLEIRVISDKNAEKGKKYILVGESSLTKSLGIEKPKGYPGEEKIIVRQTGNYLAVLGNDDGNYNGTQYAVNTLLEYLGCGWFGEGELWEVVPQLNKIDVTGLDIEHTPRFSSRITRLFEKGYAVAGRWYQGGNVSLTGHWLWQVAPASMYSEHPEWFAYTSGSRDPDGYGYYYQYCYSNPEFASFIADKLLEFFASHPDIVSMTIAANDGWDEHYCECDECKALGNASDCMVRFANNVARIVAKTYPDRMLQIYSYHMTYNPPENSVPLEKNVELMLCREASMTRPLDTDYYEILTDPITRNTYTCSWRENAAEWIEKTSCENVSVWEWYCLAAGKAEWQYIPWVQGDVASRNQQVWLDLGVKYVFYDQGPEDSYRETESSVELRWPLWYVSSKLMWGTDKSGEELLRDACEKLFGKAADEMFDYYKVLADASENCTAYSMTWVPPTVDEMYRSVRNELGLAVTMVRAAMGECTETEIQRIESQLKYYNNIANEINY